MKQLKNNPFMVGDQVRMRDDSQFYGEADQIHPAGGVIIDADKFFVNDLDCVVEDEYGNNNFYNHKDDLEPL